VERERISWILKEIDLENEPGKFDTETAVRVGKQIGVHLVVLGSYFGFEDNMKLQVRLVRVETSEIIGTAEADGDIDDFFELTKTLAKNIAEVIEIEIPDSAMQVGTRTRSLDAELAYSAGVALAEQGKYVEAYEKFLDAIKRDPEFDSARKRAEALKPLIG
jgi:hypothetical protein